MVSAQGKGAAAVAGVEGSIIVEVAVAVVLAIEGVGADSEMLGSTTVDMTSLMRGPSEEEIMAGSC